MNCSFDDLDAMLAVAIQHEDAQEPFRGVDEIAVRAIVALSHAGAALMTEASHANGRDVERLSDAARGQLDHARRLLADLVVIRASRRPGNAGGVR